MLEERKAADLARSWDDNITKKAMNPSQKEQGYIPAATELSMADAELNAQIQLDTDQAEADARSAHYRDTDDNNSPELVDGLGGMMRTAIEKVKGYKEGGNVEPKHHKGTRNRHLYGHDDPRHYLHHEDEDRHSTRLGRKSKRERDSRYGRKSRYGHDDFSSTDELAEEKLSIHDAESIIEPPPVPADDGAQAAITARVSDSPEGSAATTAPGSIVDDELHDFVTEQLYIHSKLMIVDDRIIICGSAK